MPHKVDNSILIPEIGKLLQEGKDVRFTPTGVSMRPFIEGERDTVVLRKCNSYRVGDIVLAQIPNLQPPASNLQPPTSVPLYVLHRIIAIDDQFITLQGDGNLQGTEQCTANDIFGKVVQIYKPDGHTKCLTRGRLWFYLKPCRRILLKVYRKLLKLHNNTL